MLDAAVTDVDKFGWSADRDAPVYRAAAAATAAAALLRCRMSNGVATFYGWGLQ